MGKVVEKKRKKKGRPSLLDLQKRKIKEQNEIQKLRHGNSALKPSQNYNPATPTPFRRSTRRNPAPDASSPEGDTGDDDELSTGKPRREKKLKHVLKLPNSGSGNQGGADSDGEEDDEATQNHKKRRIAAISGGSGAAESEKGENLRESETHQGIQLDSGASTPLPDKKLLLFILDRIQKKDTYGVFSEPVDPEDLPDYHEIIEHPMDFGTVKKKLDGGVYVNLEQFENDVFLICSNAMQYNSPDTVYFRQARAIQELAKKNFQDLRQDGNNCIEPVPEPKRRGRPPTKNLKKTPGRPALDRFASSDATLAGGENAASANYDPRKGQFYAGVINSLGRPQINDIYASWLTQNRSERNDELAGSSSKVSPMKYGKKQEGSDEDRRNTYDQFHSAMSAHEPSVLATFSRERKQLMAVGLHSVHGYARSLTRFAAALGPIAWEVASKKVQRSLPDGVVFGPNWVGENDVLPQRWPLLASREKVVDMESQCFNGKAEVEEKEEAVGGSRSRTKSSNGGPPQTPSRSQVPGQSPILHESNGFNTSFTLAAHQGKLIDAKIANKEDSHSDPFLPQQRPSSVPPDLNVRFNSASPSSAQPDLALQL